MAAKYIHGAFIICKIITVVCVVATSAEASCATNAIKRACDATLFPGSCYNHFHSMMISSFTQPQSLIQSTMDQLSRISPAFDVNGAVERLIPSNGLTLSALGSCRELLSLATDNLNKSLLSGVQTVEEQGNVGSWVCAAATNLQTCVDGFEDDEVRKLVSEKLESPTVHMAIIIGCGVLDQDSSTDHYPSKNRRLLQTNFITQLNQDSSGDHYPHWLTSKDRRLLQATNITPNVVVAADGSGNYTQISEAIKAAPKLSQSRFVIYVKKGSYHEKVKVDINQWNVMIYGDGMDSSIIYNNLSWVGDGLVTAETATFSALGQGFIARDIKFMNTAGAINEQAVALRIAGDRSVCYRCRIEAYQDSLFMQSNRQFYRECHIYGTIDFIFGSAAAIIQKSFIYVRKPLHGQENTITAHYKMDPHCPTGIVVQSSVVQPSEDLNGVSTYLGRPWSPYATTVFMQNNLGQLIDPKGWFPWNNSKGAPPPPNTIFLAEYANKGNGADITNRVKWQGVRANLSSAEATKFTVRSFIQGDQWIPATNVVYDPGL